MKISPWRNGTWYYGYKYPLNQGTMLTLMFRKEEDRERFLRRQELFHRLISSSTLRIRQKILASEIDGKADLYEAIDDLNDFWSELMTLYRQRLPVDQVYIHEPDLLNTWGTDYLKKYK